jgi:hypothetical protein
MAVFGVCFRLLLRTLMSMGVCSVKLGYTIILNIMKGAEYFVLL